jgi:hypothetical protein
MELGKYNLAPSPAETGDFKAIDEDALKLAEMGYTQDMQRNFSVWSVLGVGFSLTSSCLAYLPLWSPVSTLEGPS